MDSRPRQHGTNRIARSEPAHSVSPSRIVSAAVRSGRAQCSAFADWLRWRCYNLVPFNTLRRTYLRAVYHAEVGHRSYVHSPFRVLGDHRCTSALKLGDHVTVNFDCVIDLRDSVSIGDNTMIGHCSKVYTATHDFDSSTFDLVTLPVSIGSNVVVFPNSLIMPGSTIEDGCVILPGAVFSGSSTPWTVYGGVPARAVSERRPHEPEYRHRYRVWFAQS